MKAWRYKLDAPYSYKSPLLAGIFFENEWGEIEDGIITIFAGYAWDGCSPALQVGPIWLGPPDGALLMDGRPQAYYASLVHDYLCQYRADVPIRKAVTVALFREMLIKRGFSQLRASIYANAVKLFGPQDWRGDVVTG